MSKTYSTVDAAKAQTAYCEGHECPVYAPSNGWCFRCGRCIYEPYRVRHGAETITIGISVEEAGSRLITSCPHCNATFVD